MRALVLGGSGFLGRHVVAEMRRRGTLVVIGSRNPARRALERPDATGDCEWRRSRFEQLLEPQRWRDLVAACDVVVNCVGILRQRHGESYAAVHHLAPSALALACRRADVRLTHISALGLHACARSRFIRSKWLGEQGIKGSGAAYTLVRPSLLDGEGGFGARWIRALARLPLHPVPAQADGRIAVVDVRDAAEAIATLSEEPPRNGCREVELGGPHALTMAEYLRALRGVDESSRARCMAIPMPIARFASHLCDAFHVSPFSFGHLELMRRDNVPAINTLPELLGRTPRAIGNPGVPTPFVVSRPGAGVLTSLVR
jgi:uncharacterized protein YbjT (DUF2867 family)